MDFRFFFLTMICKHFILCLVSGGTSQMAEFSHYACPVKICFPHIEIHNSKVAIPKRGKHLSHSNCLWTKKHIEMLQKRVTELHLNAPFRVNCGFTSVSSFLCRIWPFFCLAVSINRLRAVSVLSLVELWSPGFFRPQIGSNVHISLAQS